MRLLNARTKKLEEFFEQDVPKYAILSHTWGHNEVTFKDFDLELGPKRSSIKIEGCCTQALTDGFDYVWIDTCCIDKSSSAELSEAINSMFAWYEKAEVCYIYLSDMHSVFVESTEFRNSRWFSRGWTLQELLAPSSLMFYNASWKPLQYSDCHDPYRPGDSVLGMLLADITGIHIHFIEGYSDPSRASVAERMSWASTRQTTRVEDTAYCLLGLFGIAMPMMYGEGTKAFSRLQEEIIRSVRDHSIFAFGYGLSGLDHDSNLAKSPADFIRCGNISNPLSLTSDRSHYTSTNNGLHIQMRLVPLVTGDWIGMLDCRDKDVSGGDLAIALPLFQAHGSEEVFFRHSAACPELVTAQPFRDTKPKQIYIERSGPTRHYYQSGIRLSSRVWKHITIRGIYPPRWDIIGGRHQEDWLRMDTIRKQVIILDCVNNYGTFLIRVDYSYKRVFDFDYYKSTPIAAEITAKHSFNASGLNYAIQDNWLPDHLKNDPWERLENLAFPIGEGGVLSDNVRLHLDKTDPRVWTIDIMNVNVYDKLAGSWTTLPCDAREQNLSNSSSLLENPMHIASETISHAKERRGGTSSRNPMPVASETISHAKRRRRDTRLERFHELQPKKS